MANSEAWRNARGEPYVTLPECGVSVHEHDTVNGYVMPFQWSFYVGDRRAYQVSKKLVGEAPSVEVLTAVWQAYQDGVKAGERSGFKDGEQAAKAHLREWLAGAPKPTKGVHIREVTSRPDGSQCVRTGEA